MAYELVKQFGGPDVVEEVLVVVLVVVAYDETEQSANPVPAHGAIGAVILSCVNANELNTVKICPAP